MKVFIFIMLLTSSVFAEVKNKVSVAWISDENDCAIAKNNSQQNLNLFILQNQLQASDFTLQTYFQPRERVYTNSQLTKSPIDRDGGPGHVYMPPNCTIILTSNNPSWGIEKTLSEKYRGADRNTVCAGLADQADTNSNVIVIRTSSGSFSQFCQVFLATMVKR